MQQVNVQIYNIRNRALKTMVNSELIAQGAKAQGITVEDLLKQIKETAVPVTDEDVAKYYETRKGKFKEPFEKGYFLINR